MANKTTKPRLQHYCCGLTKAGSVCKSRVAVKGDLCKRDHPITMLDSAEIALSTVLAGWHNVEVETPGASAAVVQGTGYHEDGSVDVFGLRALEQSILSEGDVHPDRLLRVAIVKDLLAAGHAENTKKGYDRNVAEFCGFCKANKLVAMPASVATVAYWIGELALWRNHITKQPYQASTIASKISAVSTWHKSNGQPNPVTVEVLALIRKGFANTYGRRPKQATALLMEGLVALVEVTLAPSLAAQRTATMMLLLTDPALGLGPRALERFRDWDQMNWPKGKRTTALLELPYGDGNRVIEIHGHEDPALCPLRALRDLCDASEHAGAPFANLKDGRPMTAGGIVRLAKEACKAGLVFPDRTYRLDDDERRRLQEAVLAPTDLQVRDRTLLVLDWWSATRCSEVAALYWRDLTMPGRGSPVLEVVVGRSKSDQEGKGMTRLIHPQPDKRVCPVEALKQWKPRLERLLGRPVGPEDPVFIRLDRAGRLAGTPRPMSGEAVNDRVKVLAEVARLSGTFTSHSMRAGMVTNQILKGKNIVAVSQHVGHASLATTENYVRAALAQGELNATLPDPPEKAG